MTTNGLRWVRGITTVVGTEVCKDLGNLFDYKSKNLTKFIKGKEFSTQITQLYIMSIKEGRRKKKKHKEHNK